MCGEMAGDPSATEVLIGLGLDELSMASGSILPVKKQLRTIDARRAEKVARAMMGRLTQG
jgi:phosphotransferase system enzyme I (PtsI)